MNSPNFVKSKDDTKIAYYTIGNGEQIILIPGALAEAGDYLKFANELAKTYAVNIIERRGRGLSGPQGPNYNIDREVEDVEAVIAKTGANILIGHSFGGLVALEVARQNTAIKKVAVYEPGVSINRSIPIDWAEAYQNKVDQGKPDEAFIIFIKAMNPMSRLNPDWVLKLLLPKIMGKQESQKIYNLLPANLNEHKEVARLDSSHKNYLKIKAKTLLMYGGKSPKITKLTLQELKQHIPGSKVIEFKKLDHFGLDKNDPAGVAKTIEAFLA